MRPLNREPYAFLLPDLIVNNANFACVIERPDRNFFSCQLTERSRVSTGVAVVGFNFRDARVSRHQSHLSSPT